MIATSLDSMPSVLQRLLLEPAIRSLGLACLMVLAIKLFRVKSPALRLSIWTGVLYAALGMPLLNWLLPEIPLRMEIFSSRHLVPVAPESGFELHANHLSERAANRIVTQDNPTVLTAAAVIYLLIAGILLARLGIGWLMSQKLRRASRYVTDSHVLESLTIRAKAAQLTKAPALGYSATAVVPLTMGIIRPLILLPSDWRDWPESKLSVVIEHELSHVARRDYLRQIIAEVYLSIFWLSPLGWLLKKHVAELAEQLSDDSALLAISDPAYYAEILLGFFRALERQRSRISLQVTSMARGGRASRRLDRILSDRSVLSPHLKKSAVAGLIFLTMPFVYLMAAVQPHAIQKPHLPKNVAAQTVSSSIRPNPDTGSMPLSRRLIQSVGTSANAPGQNRDPKLDSTGQAGIMGQRKLRAIRISGNASFPPDVLESALRIVRLNSPVTSEMIESDIEANLKRFLSEHGFLLSQVHWNFVPLKGEDVEVSLQITEGPQFRLADLRIKGVTIFAPDYISSQFNLHIGDVVNFSEIKDALEKIKRIYSDKGFMNLRYIPESNYDTSKGIMALTVTFEEGI